MTQSRASKSSATTAKGAGSAVAAKRAPEPKVPEISKPPVAADSAVAAKRAPEPKVPEISEPRAENVTAVPNVSPAASSTSAAGGRKRPSPVRPSGGVKGTDRTMQMTATKCNGGLAVLDVKKASGEPAFKAHLTEAILKEKAGTEELGSIGVFSRKEERTADSKMVCVGKKGDIPDKVIAVYYEEGPNENEEIQAMLGVIVKTFETYTKPFKPGMPKPKARAGKISNPDDPYHADEVFSNSDVATIITVLYPDAMEDGTFDVDEATADLLGEYFSLISIEEAKEIVLDAYAKKG